MRVPKRNNPYTYPHKSRAAKVDYICGIGGYYSRDGRFPIEFNVAAYDADFSFEHIWEKYAAECWPFDESKETPEAMKAYYDLVRRLHKENEPHMWAWGQEDAYRNLTEDDAYKMLWGGTEVRPVWELHGRGGKHLVLQEFNGVTLRGRSEEELAELLLEQSDGYDTLNDKPTLKKGNDWLLSSVWVDTLYRYIRQCEVDFTPEIASAEVEYLGATSFFHNQVNSEWETVKEQMASHEEAVEAAKAIHTYLMDHDALDITELDSSFLVLCTAAGITMDEVENG